MVYCAVCGDGSRTKGPRGGWLFQDELCFYNCFNCGIDGNFDPNREHPFSKNMRDIFKAFDIPNKDINSIVVSKLSEEKKEIIRKQRVIIPHIKKPDYFKLLRKYKDDVIADEARDFLWENYKLKDTDYDFYLSTGKTSSKNDEDIYLSKQLVPRIIIPAFDYNHEMMFWQARIFYGDDESKKYISATVDDSNAVVFGMENIFNRENPDANLYITEGFFDSWHLNGVAVITNTMKPSKIKLLERAERPKVIVPDYNKDGMNLAKQGIELGWGVSLPDILPCKDVCEAINKFGKLYVIRSIVENTHHGFVAKVKLKEFELKNDKFL